MRTTTYNYQRFSRQGLLSNTLIVAALALTLSACDQGSKSGAGSGPGGAPGGSGEARPTEVVAYTIERGEVPVSSELSGRVAAAVTAEIRPQTGGIVRKVLFVEGSEVKAGQALYEIDSTSAQTSVSSAQAALSSAEVAEASAKAKALRNQKLVAIGAVSQETAEEAEAAYKQAISAVASAQANLKAAQTSLSYANVTSPIDGRIGRSNVSEGALVTANQATALATVQQLGSVYLDATQSATEFLNIRQQFQKGEVKLESEEPTVKLIKSDGSTYDQLGKLQLSDAVVNQTTGSVTVRTLFPNPNGELIPGMYGKIKIEGAVLNDALTVPQVAISRDVKGNALVYVIGEGNVIEQRTLTTGQTLGDRWIVQSGLQEGERIVLEGLQKVQVGSVVSIAEQDKAQPEKKETLSIEDKPQPVPAAAE